MNKLLANAIEAHGGLLRWKQFVTIEADVVSDGELLRAKGQKSAETMHVAAALHEQACATTFVKMPDKQSVFRPDRVSIETADGQLIAERFDPRASFADHGLDTPWDPFHRSYFGGYAMWSYLTSPISLAAEGAQVWDIDPLAENGELWQGIRVVLPSRLATHSRAQEFYFGDDFLLRRQDYTVDVAGGFKVANYALDIVDVDGLKMPSKRRAYICNKKYEVARDKVLVKLDMSNFKISTH